MKPEHRKIVYARLMELLVAHKNSTDNLAQALNVPHAIVRKWKERGYVTVEGSRVIDLRIGGKFSFAYMRPDSEEFGAKLRKRAKTPFSYNPYSKN